MNIHISNHALIRWQQRAAQYANATEQEMRQAIKDSIRIHREDPLPFPRRWGMVYFFHKASNGYFIGQHKSVADIVIVTYKPLGAAYEPEAK